MLKDPQRRFMTERPYNRCAAAYPFLELQNAPEQMSETQCC